jgi:putative ABC transport system permease protein
MNFLFFKLAFRNILRNRFNSIINIVGFSTGLAASLFIFIFIKFETGFDNFHVHGDRLYRVVGAYHTTNNVTTTGYTWYPTAPDIKNEIPGVEDFCRVSESSAVKCHFGEYVHKIDKFCFVDENFFHFFNFQLVAGNPKTVLSSADKIVLTREKARQIFGKTDPLGQSLIYNHKLFTVAGIASDPPANTHLSFDALASIKYVEQSNEYWKEWGGGITFLSYLLLYEKVDPLQIESALPALLYKKVNRQSEGRGFKLTATLQNIKDVHLTTGPNHFDCSTNRDKKSIYTIASIFLLILLLAIVNYVILSFGQKISKTKDIGILKVHGVRKYGLMVQAYTEVLIIATVASVLGILLLSTGIPFLNKYLYTSVVIWDNIFPALVFLILVILLLSFIVTFFSTRRIVALKSIDSLKNIPNMGSSNDNRGNLLISFQFAVVIFLLISGFVINRQYKFFLNKELGFTKENIITLISDEGFYKNELSGFKQDLQRLPEIRSVSLSSQVVGADLTMNGYVIGNENGMSLIKALYTDADFLKCFDIPLMAGRNFYDNSSLDKNAILINRQLVKRAGWDNPLEQEVKRNGKLKVIGVTENFNFASLKNVVKPMVIMCNPGWDGWGYSVVNIRYRTSDIQRLTGQINKLWKARFPETPCEISFLDTLLKSNYESLKAQQRIINFFSFLGLLVAIIGLFGFTVFIVRRRIKEIGIRKVNGARIFEVMAMLNKDFTKGVTIAFVIACPIAWYAMNKWLQNFAYKTELSWWIFAAAGALAMAVALLTVSWQSWRAASKNPVEALRYE